MYEKVIGLTLKPSKCVLIPLSTASCEHNVGVIQEWLSKVVPEWGHFKIANSGKYLGIYLGPGAGDGPASATASPASGVSRPGAAACAAASPSDEVAVKQ